MREWQSQTHVKHYCKYHIVFVPIYRKKAIYEQIENQIGDVPHTYANISKAKKDLGYLRKSF